MTGGVIAGGGVGEGVAESSEKVEMQEDEYDKMLRDLIKARPDLLKKYSKDTQRTKDIESGKELNKLVKKNPGVVKTYSDAVKRDKKLGISEEGVAEGSEDNPVAQAIIRRILTQRQDLLKYGADLVGDAIDDVASFVGHVDEIGTSDVSNWVKQVEDYVKRTAQGRGDQLNEISDESLIKYLVGVHQDALKHKSDPTKRKSEKASKSVTGFSRAFNKLDARQAQELAPRVGEDFTNDTKSAKFDPMKYNDFMDQNDELHREMSAALKRRDDATYQKLLTKYLSLHDRGRKGMVPEAAEEKIGRAHV